MFQLLTRNWKTTIAGLASIATGAVGLALNEGEAAQNVGLIVAGIGLLFGKDAGGK